MVRIKKVTDEGRYYHVRYRRPSQFREIRTPQWAQRAATSESKGAKVRMGRTEAGNWLVQAVLIRKRGKSKQDAMHFAGRIRRKVANIDR